MRWQDLLREAKRRISGRRGQAQIARRRAVSDAYYAVFHCVTSTATERWIGDNPQGPPLAAQVERWFQHGQMKKVALWGLEFPNPRSTAPLKPAVLDLLTLASTKPPTSILTPEARVALQAIKELQEARHRADYDSAPRANFSHTEAVTLIDQARDGCAAIRKMRRTASGRVLLLLMFIGDQIAPAR